MENIKIDEENSNPRRLVYNGQRTAFLDKQIFKDETVYTYVSPYFELNGIIKKIPEGCEADEVSFHYFSGRTEGDFKISLEDLYDARLAQKTCYSQHFILRNNWCWSLAYDEILRQVCLGMTKQNFSYEHKCLGWTEIEGKKHFLLDKNEISEGVYSTCIRPFGRFTNGDESVYDAMLNRFVFTSTEMSLAYVLSFTGVLVARIEELEALSNICVGLSGRSGTGKTTAAKLIASVWADPYSTSGGVMMSNDASDLAFTAQFAGLYGVPAIFDDTDAESKRDVSRLIYRISKGDNRKVCKVNGDIDTSRMGIKGIVLFTSETPLLEECNRMGLQHRYLDLCDVQWTKDAESSDFIQACCAKNFGFKGKTFATYMETLEDEYLTALYQEQFKFIDGLIKKRDSFTQRSLKKYAAVLATAHLLNQCFNLSLDTNALINLLLPFEEEQVSERDKATLAYNFLHDFFYEHYHHFSIYESRSLKPDNFKEKPEYGNARFDKDGTLHLYINVSTCKKILDTNNFTQLSNYKKFWKTNNLTICQGDRYDCSATGKLYQRHFHFVYKNEKEDFNNLFLLSEEDKEDLFNE